MMRILLVTLVLFISQVVAASQLVSDESVLNIISTKKGNIAEIHSFSALTGSLSDSGAINVSVPLASINTGIGIRDQRMREFLFNIKLFPTATFTANIDLSAIEQLRLGELAELAVDGQISMNDLQAKALVNVVVVRQLDGSLIVATKQPFIINASDFGYIEGINKLKELAALPSISTAVPVTFSVVFN